MATIYGQSVTTLSRSSKPGSVIVAVFPSGTTNVTLIGNGKTWEAASSTSTRNVYFVTDIGYTYTLSGTKDGEISSVDIVVDQIYKEIEVDISFLPDWYYIIKNGAVGDSVLIDNYSWLLVNKTQASADLGLQYWYTNTTFGSTATYSGSQVANLCTSFEENELSLNTKDCLNNVSVENVTAKVFIPSYYQASNNFSWYAAEGSNRVFKTSDGTSKDWWLSSSAREGAVYYVNLDFVGTISAAGPGLSLGFRPHIEVNLTL